MNHFRFLAFGAAAAAGLGGYGVSFCTECYYKPGTCGPVHQGSPLPASPPPHPLNLNLRAETSPPMSILPSQQTSVRSNMSSSPAFQVNGPVKG